MVEDTEMESDGCNLSCLVAIGNDMTKVFNEYINSKKFFFYSVINTIFCELRVVSKIAILHVYY